MEENVSLLAMVQIHKQSPDHKKELILWLCMQAACQENTVVLDIEKHLKKEISKFKKKKPIYSLDEQHCKKEDIILCIGTHTITFADMNGYSLGSYDITCVHNVISSKDILGVLLLVDSPENTESSTQKIQICFIMQIDDAESLKNKINEAVTEKCIENIEDKDESFNDEDVYEQPDKPSPIVPKRSRLPLPSLPDNPDVGNDSPQPRKPRKGSTLNSARIESFENHSSESQKSCTLDGRSDESCPRSSTGSSSSAISNQKQSSDTSNNQGSKTFLRKQLFNPSIHNELSKAIDRRNSDKQIETNIKPRKFSLPIANRGNSIPPEPPSNPKPKLSIPDQSSSGDSTCCQLSSEKEENEIDMTGRSKRPLPIIPRANNSSSQPAQKSHERFNRKSRTEEILENHSSESQQCFTPDFHSDESCPRSSTSSAISHGRPSTDSTSHQPPTTPLPKHEENNLDEDDDPYCDARSGSPEESPDIMDISGRVNYPSDSPKTPPELPPKPKPKPKPIMPNSNSKESTGQSFSCSDVEDLGKEDGKNDEVFFENKSPEDKETAENTIKLPSVSDSRITHNTEKDKAANQNIPPYPAQLHSRALPTPPTTDAAPPLKPRLLSNNLPTLENKNPPPPENKNPPPLENKNPPLPENKNPPPLKNTNPPVQENTNCRSNNPPTPKTNSNQDRHQFEPPQPAPRPNREEFANLSNLNTAIEVQNEPWYFGEISRELAQSKLTNVGDYLVRLSPNKVNLVLSVMMKQNMFNHFQLKAKNGMIVDHEKSFEHLSDYLSTKQFCQTAITRDVEEDFYLMDH